MIARALVALALGGALASPAAAQRQAVVEGGITLRGVVVDGVHGDPLPNTMIRLVEANRGVLTDSLGRFTIGSVEPGPELMAVKQYGYEEVDVELDLREDHPTLRIELQPGPIALQGFDIVADRLAEMKQRMASRRNAVATSVRTFDQTLLTQSAARDMRDFLEIQANVRPVPCSDRGASSFGNAGGGGLGWSSSGCVERRGGVAAPRVYIDESWAMGGLDELDTYKPYEFYTVEVYAQGGEIRAYTHNFMERMARRPMALIPIGLWFDR